MNKKLWKNMWFVAFLLLVIGFAAGLMLFALVNLGLPSEITGFSGLLAALVLGMLYVKQTKKVMAVEMRRNVAVIYGVVQLTMTWILLAKFGDTLGVAGSTNTILGFAALLLVAYCLLIYWLLKFGGEQYKKRH